MRKSQAALEFLTTYAWAFVVISISVGALYYFGVFDLGKYLPQKCVFPSQFKCLDFSLKPTEVKAKLINNIGEDICVRSFSITNDASSPVSCPVVTSSLQLGACSASEFEWERSEEQDLSFSSCAGGAYISGERVELKVSFSYYSLNTPSRPIHMVNGKINGRVSTA